MFNVPVGGDVSLRVYVAGYPPIQEEEIYWKHVTRGIYITSGGEYRLLENNTHLLIEEAIPQDAGMYQVNVIRQVLGQNLTRSLTINLNVLGKDCE